MSESSSQLKRLRTAAGLSAKTLIGALDVSQATYYRWEKGESHIPDDKIPLLCKLLNCTADALLGVETPAQSEELQTLLGSLRERSEMRMLFSLAKDATADDVMRAVRIIEALRDKEG